MDLQTTPTAQSANPPATDEDGRPAVDLKWLHPDLIAPSLTNPRKSFDEGSLNELANSLLDGQAQPIVVRYLPGDRMQDTFAQRGDGKPLPVYELVVGERRWRAAQIINAAREAQRQQPGGQWTQSFELRAEVRAMTDMEVIRTQIVENLHREEVHPLEEAEGYDYLLHHSSEGVTVDQVANEVGKSRRYVFARMQLLRLCPEARDAFRAGALDASTALLVASIPTPGLQIKAVEEIAKQANNLGTDKLSYRNAKRLLQVRFQLQLVHASWDIADAKLLPEAGACSTCPKRTGNQPELFDEDVPTDTCTDPDCFEAKRIAQVKATVAAARKTGQEVIEGDQAKELMPYGPDQTWGLRGKGLRDLSDVAYHDEETHEPYSFADLLQRMAEAGARKKIKTTLIVHPDHPDAQPTQVISNEAAQQLLDKFAPKPKKRDRTPEELDRERMRAERARDEEVTRLLEAEVRRHLLAAADRPRTIADLAAMLFVLAGETDYNEGDLDELAELAQADADTWEQFLDSREAKAWLLQHLIAQTPEALSRIAMSLMVNAINLSSPEAAAMAASHGMDVDATRTRLQAQVLREQNDQAEGKAGGADSDEDADA